MKKIQFVEVYLEIVARRNVQKTMMPNNLISPIELTQKEYNEMIHRSNKKICLDINEQTKKELEELLINFINQNVCFKFDGNYSEYRKNILIYFQNIIDNIDVVINCENIVQLTREYVEQYNKLFSSNSLVNIFVQTVKNLYNNDCIVTAIKHNKSNFTFIPRDSDGQENVAPVFLTTIIDIEQLEQTLREYLDSLRFSKHPYSQSFYQYDENTAIQLIFKWTFMNATRDELLDVNLCFKRYIDYINEKNISRFMEYKNIGNISADELYFKFKKSDISFETPYYMSFMVYDKSSNINFELPNVRLGFYEENGFLKAKIFAVQSSKSNDYLNFENSINKCYKIMFGKENKYREYNPEHLVSIILAIGILKGMGINEVSLADLMPFRYNKWINEGLDENTCDNRQYRLTKKFLNNFLKLCIYFEGIEFDGLNPCSLECKLLLKENIFSADPFCNNLYQSAYNYAKEAMQEDKKLINE